MAWLKYVAKALCIRLRSGIEFADNTLTPRLAIAVGAAAALLSGTTPSSAGQALRLCINQEAVGAPTGELSEHLVAALGRRQPGVSFAVTPLPWARCLAQAERGEFDGILAGSHSDERAKLFAYPLKPDRHLDPGKRMFNLGFVLVRRVGSRVRWDGERFHHLDGPLGAQRGYSVVEFLRTKQIDVDDGNPTVAGGLKKLVANRIGAMVVNPFSLTAHSDDPEVDGFIEVTEGPMIQKKPYFLIFSNTFKAANPALVSRLWKSVEAVRKTREFSNLYSAQLSKLQSGVKLEP